MTENPNPLVLPEHVRKAFQTRLLLQRPGFYQLTPKQTKAITDDLDRAIDGLPPGAAMALFSLAELADQGNEFAKVVFEGECLALGLARPFDRVF